MDERTRIQKAYEKVINEAKNPNRKLVYHGVHLQDNLLDEITLGELEETITSNIPIEKLDNRSAMKEFEDLLKAKVRDARYMAKKIIPDMVKELQAWDKWENER